MIPRSRSAAPWLTYLDLACVLLAGGAWYAFPQLGAWPLLVGLAPWPLRWIVTRRPTARTGVGAPLALFLLTAGVAVWSAYDRAAAWPKFWLIVGGVLVFYALVNSQAIGDQRAWLLSFFGAGVALYFLATHDWDAYPAKFGALTSLGRLIQRPLPDLPGHRLHPNVAGGIMAMMVSFPVWLVASGWHRYRITFRLEPRAWLRPATPLAIALLMLFALLMTASRGAWVALGCALALAGLWLALGRLGGRIGAWRPEITAGLVLLMVCAVIIVALVQAEWLLALLNALPGPNTGMPRVELLREGLALARDYPFIGAGLGGYMMVHATYALLLHVGFTVHSHNLLLNVAVEQGALAACVLVVTWLVFLWLAWPRLRKGSRTNTGLGILAPAILSLVVLLVHGLVDDVLYGSRAVLLLFVPLAFAAPDYRRSGVGAVRTLGTAVALALVVLSIVAIGVRGWLLSRVHANVGAVHQTQAELSTYAWPEWPIQDEVRRAIDLSRPISEFQRALAFDRKNPTANRRLGMIELSRGEYEQALQHVEQAYAVEPRNQTTRQLLGEALAANGRWEEARTLWAGVRNSEGQLSIRLWWYQHLGDAQRAEWIRLASGIDR